MVRIQDFINKDAIFICICELEPSVSGDRGGNYDGTVVIVGSAFAKR